MRGPDKNSLRGALLGARKNHSRGSTVSLYNKVGFLTFDNLLSRRKIGYLDFISLKQFSTQIALAIDNAMLFERVQELSNYDELTKLPVRRFFNEKFADVIRQIQAHAVKAEILLNALQNQLQAVVQAQRGGKHGG